MNPAEDTSQDGGRALEIFAETPRLNRWMVDQLRDWIHGDVLEVGSGIGNLSIELAELADTLVATELEDSFIERLRTRFEGESHVEAYKYDLSKVAPKEIQGRTFDAIVAVNVIEHIEDAEQAVARIHEMLKPGGHFLVYVPAHNWAFGPMDAALGHFRRYNERALTTLLRGQGFELVRSRYMNPVGLLGWFVSGRVMKSTDINETLAKAFDRLVPVWRQIDRVDLPFGLGVTAVAKKRR